MPLTAITATLVAAYIGVGALDSWHHARRTALSAPEKLCSDACRQWQQKAHHIAVLVTTESITVFVHFIAGLQWPISIFKRCKCFREAAKPDS